MLFWTETGPNFCFLISKNLFKVQGLKIISVRKFEISQRNLSTRIDRTIDQMLSVDTILWSEKLQTESTHCCIQVRFSPRNSTGKIELHAFYSSVLCENLEQTHILSVFSSNSRPLHVYLAVVTFKGWCAGLESLKLGSGRKVAYTLENIKQKN